MRNDLKHRPRPIEIHVGAGALYARTARNHQQEDLQLVRLAARPSQTEPSRFTVGRVSRQLWDHKPSPTGSTLGEDDVAAIAAIFVVAPLMAR